MKTKVIFRIWPKTQGGDVIALFPQIASTVGKPQFCMSYQHIGQHGGADLQGLTADLRLATPEEYAPLKRELEGLGYSLLVAKKIGPMDRWLREKELATPILEHCRKQLRAECISYGELHELQCLSQYIGNGDVELLEAAGVSEEQARKECRL